MNLKCKIEYQVRLLQSDCNIQIVGRFNTKDQAQEVCENLRKKGRGAIVYENIINNFKTK